VRLIRDPLADAAPSPAERGAPRRGAFGFPGAGRRFVVETPNGFLSWGVPNSPRAKPSRARRLVLPAGERLVAAGSVGRRLLAVATNDRELVIYGWRGTNVGTGGRTRVVVAGAVPIDVPGYL